MPIMIMMIMFYELFGGVLCLLLFSNNNSTVIRSSQIVWRASEWSASSEIDVDAEKLVAMRLAFVRTYVIKISPQSCFLLLDLGSHPHHKFCKFVYVSRVVVWSTHSYSYMLLPSLTDKVSSIHSCGR